MVMQVQGGRVGRTGSELSAVSSMPSAVSAEDITSTYRYGGGYEGNAVPREGGPPSCTARASGPLVPCRPPLSGGSPSLNAVSLRGERRVTSTQ
eukprot:3418318-Pyramimonas_sp.AAC.1